MGTRRRAPAGCAQRDESGFTLVELLLTITILGLGGVVVIGGMMTSIKVSDVGRRQADAQTQLRAYAEAVAGAPYANCAATYATGYSPPAGFTAAMAVAYWDGTSAFTAACGTDGGLQRVTLTITATDAQAVETVAIAKRTP